MIGGGARPARPGGHIHKNEIGGGAAPIGEMRKIQDRFLASASRPGYRHHRQGGEDAVARIQLHRDSGEQTCRGAAHRPHEIGGIGRGEHLLDVPGLLPVSLQVNLPPLRVQCPRSSTGNSP